ncbi:hypothetical protein EW146_g5 [Bondarzewia mesenterica]|uniref:Uncharacterized protein n=1 Tax=Bondarzewia mesenterica TaxID=1095465 RepID=A0A4S4MEI9_9AGAM|nr:hypothetical protein EW146_g5 [Bondarzewia mesenterica]
MALEELATREAEDKHRAKADLALGLAAPRPDRERSDWKDSAAHSRSVLEATVYTPPSRNLTFLYHPECMPSHSLAQSGPHVQVIHTPPPACSSSYSSSNLSILASTYTQRISNLTSKPTNMPALCVLLSMMRSNSCQANSPNISELVNGFDVPGVLTKQVPNCAWGQVVNFSVPTLSGPIRPQCTTSSRSVHSTWTYLTSRSAILSFLRGLCTYAPSHIAMPASPVTMSSIGFVLPAAQLARSARYRMIATRLQRRLHQHHARTRITVTSTPKSLIHTIKEDRREMYEYYDDYVAATTKGDIDAQPESLDTLLEKGGSFTRSWNPTSVPVV